MSHLREFLKYFKIVKKYFFSNLMTLLASLCAFPLVFYFFYKYKRINRTKNDLHLLLGSLNIEQKDFKTIYNLNMSVNPFAIFRQRFLHRESLLANLANTMFDMQIDGVNTHMAKSATSSYSSIFYSPVNQQTQIMREMIVLLFCNYLIPSVRKKIMEHLIKDPIVREQLSNMQNNIFPENMEDVCLSVFRSIEIANGEDYLMLQLDENSNVSYEELQEIDYELEESMIQEESFEFYKERNIILNKALDKNLLSFSLALQQKLYNNILNNFLRTKNVSYLIYGEELICLVKLNKMMPYFLFFLKWI